MITMERAIDDLDRYVNGVLDGSIVASRYVIKLVERHVKDVKRSKGKGYPYFFDRQKADKAIEVFPLLFVHTIGRYAGTPFKLEPWQAFIVGLIFGWRNDKGKRRFRRLYITLARKQGKSTLAAALAIMFACLDQEEQAQVFLGATKKDQAKVVFEEVKRMIPKSKKLTQMARPMMGEVQFPDSSSYIRPLSSDRPFDGLNPHVNVLDELHAFQEKHRGFWDTITTGSDSREQPLDIIITTAGDSKSLIWKELDSYSCSVLEGTVEDETLLPFIARLDSLDELFDESAWPKAMPNLGVSVDLDKLQHKAKEMQYSRAGINRWTRYHANMEVSGVVDQLIDAEDWDNCQGELSDWTAADAIATGIDAGGLNDLFASVDVAKFACGLDDEGQQEWRYEVRCRAYMDADSERDLNEEPWHTWVYNDDLKVVNSLFRSVFDDTIQSMWQDQIQQVGFDPFNMQQMGEQLQEQGFDVVKIPQTRYNYHEPITLLIDLVRKGLIKHDGHPVLKFAVTNLSANADSSDRMMPDRKNSKDKIDPAVAMLMALRLSSLAKSRSKGSFFVT